MQSSKGLDSWYLPASPRQSVWHPQLKVLATIYWTGFKVLLVQRSVLHHRIVFVVL
ncbi:hypothetical protein V8C40DRAFT_231924 [Trichoderma camerunense]